MYISGNTKYYFWNSVLPSTFLHTKLIKYFQAIFFQETKDLGLSVAVALLTSGFLSWRQQINM